MATITGDHRPSIRSPQKEKHSGSYDYDGKFWTRSERKQWMVGLFFGTAILYSSRTLMPFAITYCAQEMGWDRSESGMVLSAFFWGYTMTQFLGGYISDRVGAEIVIPIATCMWSLVTFWTPQFVQLSTDKYMSLYIVVVSRVLLGTCQGFHYPSMTSLISHKVSERERSFTYCMVAAGSTFGTLMSGWIGSILIERYNWTVPFYLIGLLGLTWMLIMRYTVISKTRRTVSSVADREAQMLDAGKYKTGTKSTLSWVTLFTKPAFWSLLVGHFVENNAFYILLSWLPTYFHENFPSASSWVFNVVPWVVTLPCGIGSGWISDKMIAKGYSITFVRKLMETLALLGTSLFLIIISYVESYTLCLACMAAAVACCSFHNSGIAVNPQDIAPNHAGSVFGIMNMAGAIPGFVGVYVAGHILEETKSWTAVFNQTAFLNIVGWALFLVFGTGKRLIY